MNSQLAVQAARAPSQVRWLAETLRVVKLRPDGPRLGTVLLSYVNAPFLLPRGASLPTGHTHHWEARQMARTFLGRGFAVDVISYHNRMFQPRAPYDVFVDARWNMQRLAARLGDCLKLMHLDTAHSLVLTDAELQRLLALQRRRGVTLAPRRFEPPNQGIEHADAATILGNSYAMGTYRYAHKPLHPIPVSAVTTYPWPEGKDFDACRRRFLWLGSGGMVHKGLDRVLEVFARSPELHLTVCGPVEAETDFVAAYGNELYETPNIKTVGWLDLTSPRFEELVRRCAAFVYPSCSEGSSGAVVACLHAGLVPVVSAESGVDLPDGCGTTLVTSSIHEIDEAVQALSQRPSAELEAMARQGWTFARSRHTRAAFAQRYAEVIDGLLDVRHRPRDAG